MGARRDGSMGLVETVITDIRESTIQRDEAGEMLNESWLTPEAEKFWTVILERFAAYVVNQTLPTDRTAREEALGKARDLGIDI
jgi:hypothetical protein